jgi:hypothetical protein
MTAPVIRLPPCTCCGQPVWALRLCECGHGAHVHGGSDARTRRKPCSHYDETGPCPCAHLKEAGDDRRA